MNDKQQLAAMGEHLAEQQQPMCLQKRVEQLEALLREARDMMDNQPLGFSGMMRRIDEALDDATPAPIGVDEHPMQPLMLDHTGRLRFKKNSVVEYLAEGRLNEVASRGHSDEDMTQLAQLIGYSLDGFSELSYVSGADYERAMMLAGRASNA